MLKQITMLDALERIVNGERVRCLVPGDTQTWSDYKPMILNDYLAQSGIAVFTEADPEYIEPEPAAEKPAFKSAPVATRKVDTGKLYALSDAGWTPLKIADELGCSEQTVRNWLHKREEDK